jgi:hypothetical protein
LRTTIFAAMIVTLRQRLAKLMSRFPPILSRYTSPNATSPFKVLTAHAWEDEAANPSPPIKEETMTEIEGNAGTEQTIPEPGALAQTEQQAAPPPANPESEQPPAEEPAESLAEQSAAQIIGDSPAP